MSKLNELLHGRPADVADQLAEEDATNAELRAALMNALNRIAILEREVVRLGYTGLE